MSECRRRIAIIGGGITGLAAAHHFQSQPEFADSQAHLFEAGASLGGVLQTDEYEGFRLEYGPDSILSRERIGIELCQRLGIADDLLTTNPDQRGVYVVSRGRLQRVPEGLALMAPQRIWPFVTTPILSWAGKLRLAAEPLVARRQQNDDESLADFARRRLGREAYERLVQPLAGGIYMGDPEQLSVRATFPQFTAMEEKYGSLVRGARAGAKRQSQSPNSKAQAKEGASQGPQYSMFVAPRRGLGQLVQALEEQLDRDRVATRCQTVVKRVAHTADDQWAVEMDDSSGGATRREFFDAVVMAAPTYASASILADTDSELSGLLEQIRYAGCVVVNLAFHRDDIPHPLDSFGFIVPHVEQRSILACTFCSVKYAERAPEGKVLLRLFLGGGCRPEVLDWSEEQILEVVGRELRELLGVQAAPLFTRVKRWHRSLPQYQLGHQELVKQIEARVETLSGLEIAGNAYRGVGIPHCIRSGQQAIERLKSALGVAEHSQLTPQNME